MAKKTIKVETDHLTQLAVKYKNLAETYKTCCINLENKLKEYDTVWKGSFSENFDEEISKLKKERDNIYNNCTELAKFLDEAVQYYKKLDKGLIPKEDVNDKKYPSGVEVSSMSYSYGGSDYRIPDGFDTKYAYYQYDEKYNGSMDYACSLCAMATVLSMIQGKEITPEYLKANGYWNSDGAIWKGYTSRTNSGYKGMYNSIVENGKPCVIRLSNPNNRGSTHYVAAVGIREGADPNNLTKSDILTFDPAKGCVMTLAEVEKYQISSRNRYVDGDVITW